MTTTCRSAGNFLLHKDDEDVFHSGLASHYLQELEGNNPLNEPQLTSGKSRKPFTKPVNFKKLPDD